jgi:hypothetical protein
LTLKKETKMSKEIDGSLNITELRAGAIDAGHISVGIWNGKQGAESRMGVKHLYSDAYREKWPQDQYPELYQEDVPVD